MTRRAIVLFNLGGPDAPESVQPFLRNLFGDPAIIGLPALLRLPLARLVAARRAPLAREIYARLGGGSPLLANTVAQAKALEAALGGDDRCFIAMRYWHPLTAEAVREVAEWSPDEVVLLPLYPQFSTTTTASSLSAWKQETKRAGFDRPTRAICCYPTAGGFVAALADGIRPVLDQAAADKAPVRLLLSAHGLPKKIVAAGDPYQQQVELTATAVVGALGRPGLDWRVCYQSRVGPLEWIGPSVDDEVRRAGAEGTSLVVAPIAFVSEHSETLVELDIEYRHLAEQSGVPGYRRVPTVGAETRFIASLAELVRAASRGAPLATGESVPPCSVEQRRCALRLLPLGAAG